jgi:cytochrome c biogenesis protein CcdA/thiol-disulfide isomerase/thioredoxin
VALLLVFALLAGAGTALSPCVLPVLPALLSAGATGGRRRPLGIVLGLAATFTVTVAGFARVVDGVGLGDGTLRSLAVLVLLGFGLALLAPRVAARLEAPLSRLARWGPRSRGEGFASGLGVGAALGFVHAPCAGPILAGVITVGAASGAALAVAVAYALGTAVVLLAPCLGGRRVLGRVHGPALQRALGAMMVLTAVAIGLDADLRFQTALAGRAPAVLVNPTGALERSGAVERRLAELRGRPRFEGTAHAATRLPVLGTAPDFVGTQRWFNTPGGRRLELAGLRGRVALIDFWTYTCINCLRTLPHLRAWDERYRGRGLTIVGVHTPEFAFERDYLGADRADRFRPEPPTRGTRTYHGLDGGVLPLSHFSLDGTWRVDGESAEAVRDASISARVVARSVYLVLSSRGRRGRTVQVLLDGEPLRRVSVRRQRLYRLVALPRTEEHRLTLRVPPGVAGYAFTFG